MISLLSKCKIRYVLSNVILLTKVHVFNINDSQSLTSDYDCILAMLLAWVQQKC